MKQIFSKLSALAMLVSMAPALADNCCSSSGSCSSTSAPYYSIRSQSVNAVRELVGWDYQVNLCGMDATYGSFSITPEYTQTFWSDNITACLFNGDLQSVTVPSTATVVTSSGCCSPCDTGCSSDCGDCGNCSSCNSCCPSQIVISGSAVADRGDQDWLADYFFLPRDYRSVLSFAPQIRNVNIDLNFYLGLDELTDGLWFRIHAPITWTQWRLNFSESITAAGTNADTLTGGNYPAGYFSDVDIATTKMRADASAFLTGGSVTIPVATDSSLGAVTMQPLKFAKFLPCGGCDSEVRLSDIEMVLGYNFVCDEDSNDYHFGLGIRASAPTGNKPCGQYLFEPIVGSGGHWKLGGTLTAHYIFWRSEDQESSFGLWVDGNVQHLFNACQTRVFDLKGKPNSRYALAERLVAFDNATAPGDEAPFGLTTPAAEAAFGLEYAPVANLTASQVQVSMDVEGDVVVKFGYMSRSGFEVDFGYEFWGISCEKICKKSRCPGGLADDTSWALKGQASVIGFGTNGTAGAITGDPVLLAATQSAATIHGGTNTDNLFTNADIDATVTLAESPDGTAVNNVPAGSAFAALDDFIGQTNSSSDPVYITNADIGYADAQTKGMSNKVFAHFNYTWKDHEDWIPYLGVGASAEFGEGCNSDCGSCSTTTTTTSNCGSSCGSCCHDCSVSQWAVWLKAGVSFQ